MRTLVHLSDVHFGRVDERVVTELIETVHAKRPDLVAVSGDLTQRALPEEFERARDFLRALPNPQIVVPGNHDVPLHNLMDRFRNPLTAYKEYVTEELEPFYQDAEIAVVGMNTARSLALKGGRINRAQISRIEERLCDLHSAVTKIVVTHHPFDLPEHFSSPRLVGRAAKAMTSFARCGIDLLLAGHYHISHSGPTALRYQEDGYSAIFVQAGTACSTRNRGEQNSFNVIRITTDLIEVETQTMADSLKFETAAVQRFARTQAGWSPAA